jgi:hypothetical protein
MLDYTRPSLCKGERQAHSICDTSTHAGDQHDAGRDLLPEECASGQLGSYEDADGVDVENLLELARRVVDGCDLLRDTSTADRTAKWVSRRGKNGFDDLGVRFLIRDIDLVVGQSSRVSGRDAFSMTCELLSVLISESVYSLLITPRLIVGLWRDRKTSNVRS